MKPRRIALAGIALVVFSACGEDRSQLPDPGREAASEVRKTVGHGGPVRQAPSRFSDLFGRSSALLPLVYAVPPFGSAGDLEGPDLTGAIAAGAVRARVSHAADDVACELTSGGPAPSGFRVPVGKIPRGFRLAATVSVRGGAPFNSAAEFYLSPTITARDVRAMHGEAFVWWEFRISGSMDNPDHYVHVKSRNASIVGSPRAADWLHDRPYRVSIQFDRTAGTISASVTDLVGGSTSPAGNQDFRVDPAPNSEADWTLGMFPASGPALSVVLRDVRLKTD